MARPDVEGMARSFQPRYWFPHGFDANLSGGKIMWVYKPEDSESSESERRWAVGFFYPGGEFFTDSVFDDREKAAARVNWLNGGK